MNYYKKSGRLAVNILIASKLKERQRKSLSFSTGNKGAPPPNNEQNHPPPPQQQQQRPQQPHPSTNGTAPSSIANGNGNEASAAKSVTSAREGPAQNGEATNEEEIDELASDDGEAEDDRPLPRASTSAARPAPSPATRKRVPYNDRDKKRLVKLLARGQMVGWTKTRVYLELATDYPDHSHQSWQSHHSNHREEIDALVLKRKMKLEKRSRDGHAAADENDEGDSDTPKKHKSSNKVKKVVKKEPEVVVIDPDETEDEDVSPVVEKGKEVEKKESGKGKERASDTGAKVSSGQGSRGDGGLIPGNVLGESKISSEEETVLITALAAAEMKGLSRESVWGLMAVKVPHCTEEEWEELYRANHRRLSDMVNQMVQRAYVARESSKQQAQAQQPRPSQWPQERLQSSKQVPTDRTPGSRSIVLPGRVPKLNRPPTTNGFPAKAPTPTLAAAPSVPKPPPPPSPAPAPAPAPSPKEKVVEVVTDTQASDAEDVDELDSQSQSQHPPVPKPQQQPRRDQDLPSTLATSASPSQKSHPPKPISAPNLPPLRPLPPPRSTPAPAPTPAISTSLNAITNLTPSIQSRSSSPRGRKTSPFITVPAAPSVGPVKETELDAEEGGTTQVDEPGQESSGEVIAATPQSQSESQSQRALAAEDQDDEMEREESSDVAKDLLGGKPSPFLSPENVKEAQDQAGGSKGKGKAPEKEMDVDEREQQNSEESDQEEVRTESLEEDDLRVEAALTASSAKSTPLPAPTPVPQPSAPQAVRVPTYVLPILNSLADIDVTTSSWPLLSAPERELKESCSRRHLIKMETTLTDLEEQELEELEAEKAKARAKKVEEEAREREEQAKEREATKRLEEIERKRKEGEAEKTRLKNLEAGRKVPKATMTRLESKVAEASAKPPPGSTTTKKEHAPAPILLAATSLHPIPSTSANRVPPPSSPFAKPNSHPSNAAVAALRPHQVRGVKRPRASSEAMAHSSAPPESDDQHSKPPPTKRPRPSDSAIKSESATPAPKDSLIDHLNALGRKYNLTPQHAAKIHLACSCPKDLAVVENALICITGVNLPKDPDELDRLQKKVNRTCWSYDEDCAVLVGLDEGKAAIDKLKGKRSRAKRLALLKLLDRDSVEKLGKNGWPWRK